MLNKACLLPLFSWYQVVWKENAWCLSSEWVRWSHQNEKKNLYCSNVAKNRKFALEKHKVAYVIDNCTPHSNIEILESITLYFLPPDTTSCLPPMDQGVIQSLKRKCCSRNFQNIIRAIDNGKQKPFISVLEPMKMLFFLEVKFKKTLVRGSWPILCIGKFN